MSKASTARAENLAKARAAKAAKRMEAKVESVPPLAEDEMVKRYGPLTVDEVRAIVEACQQTRVLSLSFRGLEMKFQAAPASALEEELPLLDDDAPQAPVSRRVAQELERQRHALRELDGATVVGQAKDSLRGIRAGEFEMAEDELEMLKVTDPVAYEAVMNNDPEYDDAKPR